LTKPSLATPQADTLAGTNNASPALPHPADQTNTSSRANSGVATGKTPEEPTNFVLTNVVIEAAAPGSPTQAVVSLPTNPLPATNALAATKSPEAEPRSNPASLTNTPSAQLTVRKPQSQTDSPTNPIASLASPAEKAPAVQANRRAPIILTKDNHSLKSWAEGPEDVRQPAEGPASQTTVLSNLPTTAAGNASQTGGTPPPAAALTNAEPARTTPSLSNQAPAIVGATSAVPSAITSASNAAPGGMATANSSNTPDSSPTARLPASGAESNLSWLSLVLIGIALVCAGAVAGFVFWRRQSLREQASLISQGLSREGK
jgi:hypothetical protein